MFVLLNTNTGFLFNCNMLQVWNWTSRKQYEMFRNAEQYKISGVVYALIPSGITLCAVLVLCWNTKVTWHQRVFRNLETSDPTSHRLKCRIMVTSACSLPLMTLWEIWETRVICLGNEGRCWKNRKRIPWKTIWVPLSRKMYKLTPNSLWSGAFLFLCKIQKHKIRMRVPARALFWVLRPNRVKLKQPLCSVNHSLQNTQFLPADFFLKKKHYCVLSTKLTYCEDLKQTKANISAPIRPLVPHLTEPTPILTIPKSHRCLWLLPLLDSHSLSVFSSVPIASSRVWIWLGPHPAVCLSGVALLFVP